MKPNSQPQNAACKYLQAAFCLVERVGAARQVCKVTPEPEALILPHQVLLLHLSKRPRYPKRYTRPVPGDRVQIDSCKIGRNLYQFTAIDDCTRLRVLGLYVVKEFPFPIQRIHNDRGGEFIAQEFQDELRTRRSSSGPTDLVLLISRETQIEQC